MLTLWKRLTALFRRDHLDRQLNEVDNRAELWVPAVMYASNIIDARMHWVWLLARRRPELTDRQVRAAVDTIRHQHLTGLYGDKPDTPWRRLAMEQKIQVRPGGVGVSQLRDQFGKPLGVLMAAVGLVLLVACANVANLVLARGAARGRETALRFSPGATRFRLVRQWLAESVLLVLSGSPLGLVLASWGVRYILLFLPAGSGHLPFEAALDSTVLCFTGVISAVSTILFGLTPALRLTALDPASALKEGATQAPGRWRRLGLRRALVIAQIALSVVLVVLAGLFARSLVGLRSLDPGFQNQKVITFALNFPSAWKSREWDSFHERLVARVTTLPGVLSASYGFPGP